MNSTLFLVHGCGQITKNKQTNKQTNKQKVQCLFRKRKYVQHHLKFVLLKYNSAWALSSHNVLD